MGGFEMETTVEIESWDTKKELKQSSWAGQGRADLRDLVCLSPFPRMIKLQVRIQRYDPHNCHCCQDGGNQMLSCPPSQNPSSGGF